PAPEQTSASLAAIGRANAACDCLSAVAWRERVFGKFALRELCYVDGVRKSSLPDVRRDAPAAFAAELTALKAEHPPVWPPGAGPPASTIRSGHPSCRWSDAGCR
ncbi:MAG TPA: hypothetical protein VIL85_14090, partial [Thermomicrobiales bacterium]